MVFTAKGTFVFELIVQICPSPRIDISFYVQIFKLEVKPRKSSFRKSSNQII